MSEHLPAARHGDGVGSAHDGAERRHAGTTVIDRRRFLAVAGAAGAALSVGLPTTAYAVPADAAPAQMEIARDANGVVVATIDLSDDTGVVPEVVLEHGDTLEVVEVGRSEFLDDLDGALKKLSRRR